MIMADQLAPRWMGAYGHPLVQTPCIDALARHGTTFESAYSNCPICAPSRASMCTGRLVSRIGTYDNGSELPASQPTFVHHLRRGGYETLLSGKMHFVGPDQMHGFERRLTPEIYPTSFVWTPDWTRGAYPNPGTSVTQLPGAGRCDWSMQLDYDEEVCFRGLEALRDLARSSDERRPFFLCVSFTHPHDPFLITREWWDRYDHDAVDMPATPPKPLEAMHPYDRWLQIHHMADTHPPGDDAVRNARHAYYGMVSYFDHQVGRLTSELERLGLSDDTVVVVTSDHGEMLGEHGMWFKRTYFDPSAAVPLLFRGPGADAGQRVSRTVSLVDLFPTLLDLAGLEYPGAAEGAIDGHSLRGLLGGDDADWKDCAVGEYYSEGVCQPMRMAVGGAMKYVYVHGEDEQLFDLAADPHERTSCIANPAYAGALDRLRGLVMDGWDPQALRRQIIDSQQQRHLIHAALGEGLSPDWDAPPHVDPADRYVRRYDAQETSRRRRYPRI
jgi:choline-sulfatase